MLSLTKECCKQPMARPSMYDYFSLLSVIHARRNEIRSKNVELRLQCINIIMRCKALDNNITWIPSDAVPNSIPSRSSYFSLRTRTWRLYQIRQYYHSADPSTFSDLARKIGIDLVSKIEKISSKLSRSITRDAELADG
ncbi:hypothetical protein AA313_de0204925 [Arthrobotrys entomopaga]|nr:hypothetical protein AA313_de0204925 [Arthrobotrys entomopaga]